MESRDQAEKLFSKLLSCEAVLSVDDQGQLTKSVRKLIRVYLSTPDANSRFKYKEFKIVIVKTATHGRLVIDKASKAFENLEKYFVLLFRSPYKKEFRKIKMYCGFFQSKIRSHLEDAESLFYLVGFEQLSPGTLVLDGKPNRQLFVSVAFECVVAAVECELMAEHLRKTKEGGATIEDVVRWRYPGAFPDSKWTHDNQRVPENKANSVHRNPSYGVNNVYPYLALDCVGTVGARTNTTAAVDLPFIDDDDRIEDTGYIEGTIDDHVMASMKRLSNTNTHSKKPEVHSGHSEDWDYVRQGLEGKYGQKYYAGARGDLMNPREIVRVRNDNSDEGIDIEDESPPVLFSQSQSRGKYAPVGSDMRTSGYHTGNVYYPPGQTDVGDVSAGIPSSDTAYATQSSSRPHLQSRYRNSPVSGSAMYKPQPYTSSAAGELMPREMNQEASSKTWACGFCTLNNEAGSTVCESCGRSRHVDTDVDGPQCGDSTTVCKKCTFENQPADTACSMCGNTLDKRNVHTYV